MAAVIFFIYEILFIHNDARVVVSIDNKIYRTYNLNENGEYKIQTDYGYNILVIDSGMVYIKEADCDNKICVNTREISVAGVAICCLPHKLLVYIE